ncbi:hypothetical protein [Enterobacter ludwigii]|uniref:hypothetical protein n=1 Tax=Enterobacter ludwigii TaxID=299767 RepID=UPI003F71B687
MSIADTWSEDAFVRLMQDMLKQQKEDAEDVDSSRPGENARTQPTQTPMPRY